MPSPALLISLCACLAMANAFFILDQAPLVRTRLDPIVSPGQVSQHMHNVLGASRFGKTVTFDDLQKSKCTTAPITVDKSSYWTPQLYYYDPKDQSYEAMGNYAKTYYLQRPGNKNEKIVAFPEGLRMVAGDPYRRTYNPKSYADQAVSFVCLDYAGGHAGDPEWDQRNDFFKHQCPDGMRMQVFFPSCWNGKDLDSPDHKSHVAYPLDNFQGGNCPPGFPVHLPSLFYEFIYYTDRFPFNEDGSPTWVLANGDTTGYGFHGDFVSGWDTKVLQEALDTCGSETGGNIYACDVFKPYINTEAAAACQIELPIVDEDVGYGHKIPKLPGDNPLWQGNVTVKPSDASYNETADYKSASSSVPDGWTEVGCIAESSAGQSLLAISIESKDMTVGKCVSACAAKSLPFAGLQWGTQCRCDSKLRNGATTDTVASSQCSVKCPGLSTENCGGSMRTTLFVNPDYASTAPILPSGWVYSSCVTEGTNSRALVGSSFASDTMTTAGCVNYCNNKGFAYAGTSYGRECYCSSSIAPGVHTAAAGDCKMTCSGALREDCGGPNRYSIYYDANKMAGNTTASSSSSSVVASSSSSISVAPSSSISAAQSSSAAVSSSVSVAASSSASISISLPVFLASPTSSSVAATSSSSTIASSSSSSIFTSLTTSAVSSTQTSSSSAAALTSAATIALAPGYKPWTSPCLKQTSPKILTTKTVANSSMTPFMCTSFCAQNGLPFAGIEYGGECGCGTTVTAEVSTACTRPCNGLPTSLGCGGSSAVSVYYSAEVDEATKLVLPAGWSVNMDGPGACVTEVDGRTLSTSAGSGNDMTVPKCLASCQAGQFKYAGLEYSTQCWCSNSIKSNAVASTKCNMGCRGALAQTCGGNSALSVYSFSA